MNEKMGAYIAVIFLFFVGLFNIVFVLSNLNKRKVNQTFLWIRFGTGILVLGLSFVAYYYFIWSK